MDLKDYALVKKATLTDIGNGIREQEGSTEGIPPDEMGDRVRALVRGGVEYTTGTLVMGNNYNAQTIPHGLSKKPKLFILRWNEYNITPTILLNYVEYTRYHASVWYGATDNVLIQGARGTIPDIYEDTYSCVRADDSAVSITQGAKRWQSGEWTWEAWTW